MRGPRIRHEAQVLRLLANRLDDPRVLVPEVAALREAAHVEYPAPVVEMQPRTGPAHDGRRVPLRLDAPAVQDGISLGDHATPAGRYGVGTCAYRTYVRIAHNATIH